MFAVAVSPPPLPLMPMPPPGFDDFGSGPLGVSTILPLESNLDEDTDIHIIPPSLSLLTRHPLPRYSVTPTSSKAKQSVSWQDSPLPSGVKSPTQRTKPSSSAVWSPSSRDIGNYFTNPPTTQQLVVLPSSVETFPHGKVYQMKISSKKANNKLQIKNKKGQDSKGSLADWLKSPTSKPKEVQNTATVNMSGIVSEPIIAFIEPKVITTRLTPDSLQERLHLVAENKYVEETPILVQNLRKAGKLPISIKTHTKLNFDINCDNKTDIGAEGLKSKETGITSFDKMCTDVKNLFSLSSEYSDLVLATVAKASTSQQQATMNKIESPTGANSRKSTDEEYFSTVDDEVGITSKTKTKKAAVKNETDDLVKTVDKVGDNIVVEEEVRKEEVVSEVDEVRSEEEEVVNIDKRKSDCSTEKYPKKGMVKDVAAESGDTKKKGKVKDVLELKVTDMTPKKKGKRKEFLCESEITPRKKVKKKHDLSESEITSKKKVKKKDDLSESEITPKKKLKKKDDLSESEITPKKKVKKKDDLSGSEITPKKKGKKKEMNESEIVPKKKGKKMDVLSESEMIASRKWKENKVNIDDDVTPVKQRKKGRMTKTDDVGCKTEEDSPQKGDKSEEGQGDANVKIMENETKGKNRENREVGSPAKAKVRKGKKVATGEKGGIDKSVETPIKVRKGRKVSSDGDHCSETEAETPVKAGKRKKVISGDISHINEKETKTPIKGSQGKQSVIDNNDDSEKTTSKSKPISSKGNKKIPIERKREKQESTFNENKQEKDKQLNIDKPKHVNKTKRNKVNDVTDRILGIIKPRRGIKDYAMLSEKESETSSKLAESDTLSKTPKKSLRKEKCDEDVKMPTKSAVGVRRRNGSNKKVTDSELESDTGSPVKQPQASRGTRNRKISSNIDTENEEVGLSVKVRLRKGNAKRRTRLKDMADTTESEQDSPVKEIRQSKFKKRTVKEDKQLSDLDTDSEVGTPARPAKKRSNRHKDLDTESESGSPVKKRKNSKCVAKIEPTQTRSKCNMYADSESEAGTPLKKPRWKAARGGSGSDQMLDTISETCCPSKPHDTHSGTKQNSIPVRKGRSRPPKDKTVDEKKEINNQSTQQQAVGKENEKVVDNVPRKNTQVVQRKKSQREKDRLGIIEKDIVEVEEEVNNNMSVKKRETKKKGKNVNIINNKENKDDDVFEDTKKVKKAERQKVVQQRGRKRQTSTNSDTMEETATPPRRKPRCNKYVEYTPGSGGKKVRVVRRGGGRQTKISFVSSTSYDEPDDDFEDELKQRATEKKKWLFGEDSPVKLSKSKTGGKGKVGGKKTVVKAGACGGPRQTKLEEFCTQAKPKQFDSVSTAHDSDSDTDGIEDDNDCIPDAVRKTRNDFSNMVDYHDYMEEQDRLLALQLQADFNMEAKLKLTAIRRKGSDGEYKFRAKKINYKIYYQDSMPGPSNRKSRRANRSNKH